MILLHQDLKAYNFVDNEDNCTVTKHQTDDTSDTEANYLSIAPQYVSKPFFTRRRPR